jgi:hypothetical protein
MVNVYLTPGEIAALDRQAPSTKRNGGWQGLMVTLQEKLNRATGELTLDRRDLERIQRYAFKYKRGGWQGRLEAIFGRTLGPDLGGRLLKSAA